MVLREAHETFLHTFRQEEKDIYHTFEVQIERVTWGHDSVEEFLADYRNLTGTAKYSVSVPGTRCPSIPLQSWLSSRHM